MAFASAKLGLAAFVLQMRLLTPLAGLPTMLGRSRGRLMWTNCFLSVPDVSRKGGRLATESAARERSNCATRLPEKHPSAKQYVYKQQVWLCPCRAHMSRRLRATFAQRVIHRVLTYARRWTSCAMYILHNNRKLIYNVMQSRQSMHGVCCAGRAWLEPPQPRSQR